jgi:3-dehydroquinate dehydratase type II
MLLNGPSINMTGAVEINTFGLTAFDAMIDNLKSIAIKKGHMLTCFQSNSEGQLIDWIQQAHFEHYDGIIINPGAYTHTSIALLDAVKAVGTPTVEVHISDVSKREEFRLVSYIRAACIGHIIGHGTDGYCEAIDLLEAHHEN